MSSSFRGESSSKVSWIGKLRFENIEKEFDNIFSKLIKVFEARKINRNFDRERHYLRIVVKKAKRASFSGIRNLKA